MTNKIPLTYSCDPKHLKVRKIQESFYILIGLDDINAITWPDGIGHFFKTEQQANDFIKENQNNVDVKV